MKGALYDASKLFFSCIDGLGFNGRLLMASVVCFVTRPVAAGVFFIFALALGFQLSNHPGGLRSILPAQQEPESDVFIQLKSTICE